MGLTMIEKILARAAGTTEVSVGDVVVCEVDRIVLIDVPFIDWIEPLRMVDPERLAVRATPCACPSSRPCGWHTQAQHGQRLAQAFAQAAGRAGVGVLQFPCQRFELGFGDDRRRGVVGGPHLLGHRFGEVVG